MLLKLTKLVATFDCNRLKNAANMSDRAKFGKCYFYTALEVLFSKISIKVHVFHEFATSIIYATVRPRPIMPA